MTREQIEQDLARFKELLRQSEIQTHEFAAVCTYLKSKLAELDKAAGGAAQQTE